MLFIMLQIKKTEETNSNNEILDDSGSEVTAEFKNHPEEIGDETINVVEETPEETTTRKHTEQFVSPKGTLKRKRVDKQQQDLRVAEAYGILKNISSKNNQK